MILFLFFIAVPQAQFLFNFMVVEYNIIVYVGKKLIVAQYNFAHTRARAWAFYSKSFRSARSDEDRVSTRRRTRVLTQDTTAIMVVE